MAPSIDEFEDLTQFADESFDTEEVDLFEFTDDEDSPLLRLKSIVLSLDWDITEEILTELNEELANLRAMWKDDKVAQIYLQGMENVGKYMRTEGAYAHPNAIKLLLTLYHNYEKIISSPNISGDSITTMLKADIRKFKVLQYQISTLKKSQDSHDEASAEAALPDKTSVSVESAKQESAVVQPPPLRSMEATILGLEWEVTDEGLEKFNTEATELRTYLSGNTEAQVLIQGLQVLGAYIREQKTNAHPDAFTILHSFYDALKMLLDSPELGAEQRRQILVEQIGSLNSLKEVIARSAASKTVEEEPEIMEDDDSLAENTDDSPVNADEDEMDFTFSFADEEGSDKPESKAPPVIAKPKAVPAPPVQPVEENADEEDEFEDDLFADSSSGVIPALADEDEEGGFSDSLASTSINEDRAAELDEKLDSFFNFGSDDTEEVKPKTASVAPSVEPKKPEKLSLATIFEDATDEENEVDGDDGIDSSFFNFDDDNLASEKISPVIPEPDKLEASVDNDQRLSEVGADNDPEEDDELDSFFNFEDDVDIVKSENTAKVINAPEKRANPLSPVTGALADTNEVRLDTAEDDDTLSSGLDSFFSFDDDTEIENPKDNTFATDKDNDSLKLDSELFDEAEEKVPQAVADKEEHEPLFSFDDSVDDISILQSAQSVLENNEDALSLELDRADEQEKETFMAALDDAEEVDIDREHTISEEDDTLSSGLDSFFSFDDDTKIENPKNNTFSTDKDNDSLKLDSESFDEAEEEPPQAVADKEEHESLFSFDDSVDDISTLQSAQGVLKDNEDALSLELDRADEQEKETFMSALDDAEEVDIDREHTISEEDDTLSSGLDSFFSFEDDKEEQEGKSSGEITGTIDDEQVLSKNDANIDVERATEIKEKLDSLFNFDHDLMADEATGDAQDDIDELDDDLITALDDDELPVKKAAPICTITEENEETKFLSAHEQETIGKKTEDNFFDLNAQSEQEEFISDSSSEEYDELLNSKTESTIAEQEDTFFALDEESTLAFIEKGETDQDELFDSGWNIEKIALTDEQENEDIEPEAGDSGASLSVDTEDDFFDLNITHIDDDTEAALPLTNAFAEENIQDDLNAAKDEDEDLLLDTEYEEESEPVALLNQDEMPDPFSGSLEADSSEADEIWSAPLEEPESKPTEDQQSASSEIFFSLAAVAAALSSAPSEHHLRQISELAAAAQKEQNVPPYQSILLNLLDTSADLLAKAPQSMGVSSTIVQNLTAALNKAEEPLVLVEMISRYTAWQRDFFKQILLHKEVSSLPESNSSKEIGFHAIEEKFFKLKQEIREEFQQLKQELLNMKN